MFLNFFRKKFIDETLEEQKEDLKKETPELYQLAINGADCDSLFNNKQDFGHIIDNPIPVNGALGELKYLNRLRCECGSGLIYHGLRSFTGNKIEEPVDAFETVCMKGKHWDILYFHLYHPRRSVWLPLGYKFSDFHHIFSKYPIGYGTNHFDADFPFGLGKYILMQLGMPAIIRGYEETVKDKNKFIRSESNMKKILLMIQNRDKIVYKK